MSDRKAPPPSATKVMEVDDELKHKYDKRMRTCLGHYCGNKEFMSDWSGHRICNKCTKLNNTKTVNRFLEDEYGVQASSTFKNREGLISTGLGDGNGDNLLQEKEDEGLEDE